MHEGDMMNAKDFRELALSFDGAEEGSHIGAPDFRVGGRIFATLAMQDQGFGNLMLTPEMQRDFIAESPAVFVPVKGGWGRMGCTHIRLADATPQQLLKGLHAAWNLRVEKNTRSGSSKPKRGRKAP
jgi:YjbR